MPSPSTGPLHRLLSPFVDPSTFDFWAQQIAPQWSWRRALATVVARSVEARDTVTLTLRLNRHCAWPQAGQHINVSGEVNGRRVTRSYSPTRLDARQRTLDITVKHVPNGVLSTHLCQTTQAGEVLEIGDAFGQMTWPASVNGQWLLLAAGSGITPMISLIRQAFARDTSAQITLVYAAKTRADLCFLSELRTLAAKTPHFRLHALLSQEHDLLDGEASGRIHQAWLDQTVPDLSERQVYACGPAGFVDTVRGLTANRVRSFTAEAFTPPALGHTDTAGQPVHITLQQTGRTVTVASGQPLLPALEAHGLRVPHGCRMGVCNTCSCSKVGGTTQDLQSGESQAEPNSAVRLCISSASTDLTLDL